MHVGKTPVTRQNVNYAAMPTGIECDQHVECGQTRSDGQDVSADAPVIAAPWVVNVSGMQADFAWQEAAVWGWITGG